METAGLLNALFKYIKGDPVERNKTEVEPETCSNLLIKETLFYQLCLIPSVVIVLILCCTQKRRNLVLHVLKGRPGLVYPMDLSGRSHRISYACAFGSTVYLIVACILDSFRAIEFDGPFFLKNLILIISVLIFGIVYLPVFLCLTLGSIYGFVLGAAYTWMLTAVQLIRMSQCDYDKRTRVVVVVRNLPELLCLLYLSCVLLVRAVQAFRSRQFGVGTIERRVQDEKMEDILESTPGKRVRILLTPSWRLEKKPEASSRLRKVLTLVQELTYRWEPDFKYSARLLSTLMVGLMVLYAISFQAIVLGITSFKYLKKYADVQVNKKIELATTDAQRAEYRAQRETWETMVDYFVGPVIASQCLASLLGLYGILRMLTGYRTTMYRLYRGEMKEFTQGNSNTAILVSCLKYSGFQVAYIAWGYIIHMVFFLFICGVLSLVIALLSAGFTDWFVHDFLGLWPIPLWAIITYLVQYLLAKFFFLQDRGDYLAFDNRRSLFLFSYFMFFYNIFLGLFSTVLRLIKGMVIGAVMLPRLDHSTLPMSFAGSDPGYNAYVGFMQVECSQSHPVMVTFIRLLMLLARKREAENRKWAEKESEFRGRRPLPRPHSRGKSQKQRAAAFNWHVIYTLINNPDLRMERKGYIQTMKKARELGVRIPKSDGFVVLDPELLREAELEQKRAAEGVMSHVEDKLVAFRLMLRKKVQNGIETVTKKSSRSGSIERLNDIEMESVEEGRRGRGGGGLRSVDI